jgi:predicted nucleic acid-binding protein
VFVDTSAFFSLANLNDVAHSTVTSIASKLIEQRRRLFTSNFVVAETHALVLSKLGRDIAIRVLTDLDESDTTIVRVSAADERRGRQILAQYQDKSFSLTDATSFAIMERLRIGQAFTLDGHFAQYGLLVLGPA